MHDFGNTRNTSPNTGPNTGPDAGPGRIGDVREGIDPLAHLIRRAARRRRLYGVGPTAALPGIGR